MLPYEVLVGKGSGAVDGRAAGAVALHDVPVSRLRLPNYLNLFYFN